mmetsp:Transcript_38476/g.86349  ORF Transcript_38476/g.86349 Transcript_38476/m.86349 type:complete len:337 (+) Transcript_38476:27-1037(+)
MDQVLFSLTFGGDLCSIIACVWLILRFRSLCPRIRSRLFARQIWHLAVSDLVGGIFAAFADGVLHTGMPMSRGQGDWFCSVVPPGWYVAFTVSALVEANIALGFCFAYFRAVRALHVVSALLPLGWAIGFVTGALDSWQGGYWSGTIYNIGMHKCMPVGPVQLSVVTAMCLLCLSLGLYLAVSVSVCSRSNKRVRSDVWLRASIFPLNFLISYLPVTILLSQPELFRHPTFFMVAISLQRLNGVLNIGSYAIQSRYARYLRSAHVELRQRRESQDARDFASFRVDLEETADVVTFPATQAAALRQSEKEVARMREPLQPPGLLVLSADPFGSFFDH